MRNLTILCLLCSLAAAARDEARFPFKTFFVTWTGNGEAWVEPYVREARPELSQICFFGPMFHGYADEAKSTGYPMQLPVAGQREAVAAQRATIAALQAAGSKVSSHFQVTNIIDSDGKGEHLWATFWNERWPEDLLGPRPPGAPADVLQKNGQGEVLTRSHYHIGYVGLCPTNPAARTLQKQMLKLALDCGVDGIVTNYNYYWGCACDHCQTSFKAYLAKAGIDHGIADLAAHRFATIPAAVPGYPKAEETTPLALAAQRWAALVLKEAFDEIFIDYGRSVRPGLILGSWNHLGNLGIGEERAFLPGELWGRGEDYFWYSGGYGPTKLDEGKLGDGWLNCLYLRELGGGKPFMLGKYEQVRLRNSLAEGWATGGSGMGLYMELGSEPAHSHALAYTRFVQEQRPLFDTARPHAEVGLLLPRQALMAGRREAMDSFKAAGEALAASHLPMEIVADERLSAERLAGLRALAVPEPQALTPAQEAILAAFAAGGGLVVRPAPGAELPARLREALGVRLSRFEAPATVRIAVWRTPSGMAVHLVNFDRDETLAPKPKGPADEHPRAARDLRLALAWDPAPPVRSVRLISPDQPGQPLDWTVADGALKVTVPELLVYGIVVIE